MIFKSVFYSIILFLNLLISLHLFDIINIYGFKFSEISLFISLYFLLFNLTTELFGLKFSIKLLIESGLVLMFYLSLFVNFNLAIFLILIIYLSILGIIKINNYWTNKVILISGNFIFRKISCNIYSITIINVFIQIIIFYKLKFDLIFYIIINSIIINIILILLLNIPYNLILRFVIQDSNLIKYDFLNKNILIDIIKMSKLKI